MHRLILLATLLVAPATVVAQDAAVHQARQFLSENADTYAIPLGAAESARVTSYHTSNVSGLTYVYFRQSIDGIDVYGGDITVAVRPNGSIFYVSGGFKPAAEASRGSSSSLDAVGAAEAASRHMGYIPDESFEELERVYYPYEKVVVSTAGIAEEPVEAWLMFEEVVENEEFRLAWDVTFNEPGTHSVWSIRVDAVTGEILAQDDYVLECHFGPYEESESRDNHAGHAHTFYEAPTTVNLMRERPIVDAETTLRGAGGTYRVYADPVESPIHGEQTLVSNPADPAASPYGWHTTHPVTGTSYTITRGNNTFAYVDANAVNQPSGANNTPDGGEDLIFDFPVDLTQHPSTYRLAAVTNLFYIVNRVHDILYHHGFDEAAGNYQEINYTGAAGAGDAIRAEAQDGGGMNNANFLPTVDGTPGRIQMFLWSHTNPHRDGDFDNGIIAHEYAHGWSKRLTGGRMNNSCLTNSEQMGEGWSDFLGVLMTIHPGDYAEMRRGVGTYALGQSTSGQGIRPAPYTTDMSQNSYTYNNIRNLSIPHGVGFVWNTMLWEMTWNLIDRYGVSEDLIHGNAGNNIALTLVSEAMKLQPCSPGFVDGRNAILAADEAIFDGAHKVEIWTAFAKRGLGYSASQGSPNSTTDGTEAFDLPPGLERSIDFTVEPGVVPAREFATYEINLYNGPAMNPLENLDITVNLPFDLIYAPTVDNADAVYDPEIHTLTFPGLSVATGEELIRTFVGLADFDEEPQVFFHDIMQAPDDIWETYNNGVGTRVWMHVAGTAENGTWHALNMNSISDQYLELTEEITPSASAVLQFRHRHRIEPGFDGGIVEISVAGGEWQDLGDHFLQNGYTGTIAASSDNPMAGREAFTGHSDDYIYSQIALADFANQPVRIRFRMATNSSGGFPAHDGWRLSEVTVIEELSLSAEMCAENSGMGLGCLAQRTLIGPAVEGAPILDHDFTTEAHGTHEVGSPISFSISFRNTGDRELVLVAGSTNTSWLVTDAGITHTAPDGNTTIEFEVAVQDLDAGTHEAIILVVSNDLEQPLIEIPVIIYNGNVSGEGDSDSLPGGFALDSAYPNPFSQQATFSLRVAQTQQVAIVLYDVMGREVVRMFNDDLVPGTAHQFSVDGSNLASGVYLVRIQGEHFHAVQRITRIR